MADLIDRQTAIDAIVKMSGQKTVRDLYEYAEGRCDEWAGGVIDAIDAVIAAPSEETDITRCNECKYYHGAPGAMGHAPCSYWGSDGVMWDWFCSQGEKYERPDQLISRQAAVDALEKLDWYHHSDGGMVHGANSEKHQAWYKADDVYRMIEQLPFTEPERKTGRWIWDVNGMDWNLGAWRCSECHTKAETWWANDKKYNPLKCSGGNFCGNCGADMRGEQNESDKQTN